MESDIIWEGVLDKPVLNKGQEIYISELDRTVSFKDAIRTTKNEYMYIVTHIISDNISQDSYKQAKEDQERFIKKSNIAEASQTEKKKCWMVQQLKNLFK